MSERGSFCTEYVYCSKCFEAVKSVLTGDDKFFKAVTIPSRDQNDHEIGVVAGRIGGLRAGEEIDDMREYVEELQDSICHTVRIAVLAENGESVFLTAMPRAGTK